MIDGGPKKRPNRSYPWRRRAEGSVVERVSLFVADEAAAVHTLVVVILILLFTTDELTLFHIMCADGQSIRSKEVVRE